MNTRILEITGESPTKTVVRVDGTASNNSTIGVEGIRPVSKQLVFLTRCAYLFILLSASRLLPLFDSSPRLESTSSLSLRWDVFHFLSIAENGHKYENQWAFFPGLPWLMYYSAKLVQLVTGSTSRSNLFHAAEFIVFTLDTSSTLYQLTLLKTGSRDIALLSTLLSLIPSSPATLYFAACNEPFFTFFSYKGMLYCAESKWFSAAVAFALAGAFRSNGILLAGFLVWGLLAPSVLSLKMPSSSKIVYATILACLVSTPFMYHHYAAYIAFCSSEPRASWCTNIPPSVYTHVQSKYWNVGFLRYWTVSQIPNFLLAAPVLSLTFTFCGWYLSNLPAQKAKNLFLAEGLLPHVLHALFLSCVLLFSSHVQISLRVAAATPLTYWAAAWLLVEYPKLGRAWVFWSVIWGAVSLVLWAVFLPPA